jgi:hypothetical protein
MPEREHEAAPKAPQSARQPPSAPTATDLAGKVGNRAMARMLSRMEATEAVEMLEQSLAPGVVGAERPVIDTLTAFSANTGDFDKINTDFEKKVEKPLLPELQRVPGATEQIPEGWYPGINGQGGA